MKPFDTEAALRGEPVAYRDGTPLHFVGLSRTGVPVIQFQGLVFEETTVDCLRMLPKKTTGYINVYKQEGGFRYAGQIYPTREEADAVAATAGCNTRVDVIEYTYEE